MAKNPKRRIEPTKKHLARLERENLQKRYIILASIAVVVAVVGLIIYGLLDQYYLQSRKPVAEVNGEKILVSDFQGQTKLARYNMIQNAFNIYQLSQLMGNDPANLQPIVNQLQSIDGQLFPTVIGRQVLDQMIDDLLIKQHAETLNITVSENEVDREIETAFGYFQDGLPTSTPTLEPLPTSTLTEFQKNFTLQNEEGIKPPPPSTLETDTETEKSPESSSEGETPIPETTPTPITLEGFQDRYNETIEGLQTEYGITERDMRSAFLSSVFQRKMIDEVVGEIECTEEQIWAAHILVDDEDFAKEIKSRLDEGESWSLMASTYSTDLNNKDSGGDLGWFGRGTMVSEFEEAVLEMEIGEISEPVKSQFGWHIIQKIGQEDKPVSSEKCQQIRFEELNNWLAIQRENSNIVINDNWGTLAPDEPSLPIEMKQFINAYLNYSATPPSP